jgi:CheY-like chemotaxis protein
MRKYFGHAGRARILVEGWDQTNALTLSAMMERTGYEVATVFDGEEAVVKAATFTPDLSITEPFMGRLSGIEAATAITAGSHLSGPVSLGLCVKVRHFRRVLL